MVMQRARERLCISPADGFVEFSQSACMCWLYKYLILMQGLLILSIVVMLLACAAGRYTADDLRRVGVRLALLSPGACAVFCLRAWCTGFGSITFAILNMLWKFEKFAGLLDFLVLACCGMYGHLCEAEAFVPVQAMYLASFQLV